MKHTSPLNRASIDSDIKWGNDISLKYLITNVWHMKLAIYSIWEWVNVHIKSCY